MANPSGTSPFWGDNWSMLFNRPTVRMRIRREFRRMTAFATGQLANTLDGVVAGSTATKNRAAVTAQAGLTTGLGGVVPVANVALISRASVAADVTTLNAIYSPGPDAPTTYPSDASGNGGGSKLGF